MERLIANSGIGDVCAVNTCCPAPEKHKPGICLKGECANSAAKLVRAARTTGLSQWENTAAWGGSR